MCLHAEPTRETDERRGPALDAVDALLYDEPGRCQPQVNGTGSTDYHSYHFRVIERHGSYVLRVRHGGGDEAMDLGGRYTRLGELLAPMDSDARFLMLMALYRAHRDARRSGREEMQAHWTAAAREDRIRTRKMPRRDEVKVWIEAAKP